MHVVGAFHDDCHPTKPPDLFNPFEVNMQQNTALHFGTSLPEWEAQTDPTYASEPSQHDASYDDDKWPSTWPSISIVPFALYLKLRNYSKLDDPPFYPANPLLPTLKKDIDNGEHADVVVEVEWPQDAPHNSHVHRLYLCSFLIRMLSHDFAELLGIADEKNYRTEDGPKTIKFNVCSPLILRATIHYLYGQEIPCVALSKHHIKEFIDFANKCKLTQLKVYLEARFVHEHLTFSPPNVDEVMEWADAKHLPLVKEKVWQYLKEHPDEGLKRRSQLQHSSTTIMDEALFQQVIENGRYGNWRRLQSISSLRRDICQLDLGSCDQGRQAMVDKLTQYDNDRKKEKETRKKEKEDRKNTGGQKKQKKKPEQAAQMVVRNPFGVRGVKVCTFGVLSPLIEFQPGDRAIVATPCCFEDFKHSSSLSSSSLSSSSSSSSSSSIGG